MRIQQIGIGASAAAGVFTLVLVGADIAKEAAVHLVRAFSVAETCVEVDPPAAAPSCGLEALDFEGLECGVAEFGPGCDLVARIYSDEV